MGHHGLPHHLDDLHAAVREAVGHLRSQAAVPVRDRHVHPRVRAVRAVDVYVHAGGIPRLPGHRCRWPDLDGAGDHGRHHRAARAGPVSGLLHGRVRHLERPGSGGRRVPRRAGWHLRDHRLAVDLLHQRADRHRRARRRHPGAQARAPSKRSPHRLGRRDRADRRPGAAAGRRRAGPVVGLGFAGRTGLLPDRRRRPGSLRAHRGGDGRRGAAAAAAVPQPAVRRGIGGVVRDRHRDVRRHGVDPALPPGGQGRIADQGRPARSFPWSPG